MYKRIIPATMATQHPDNASTPFWERDGDGFVSAQEEITEAVSCYKALGVGEFMWDWEGKHADEAVIDKFFTRYYDFFRTHPLGEKRLLTFRIPNIWEEKGHSLLRAFMVMLTSEDLARDLVFPHRPLFEVILPMTKRASQLMYLHTSFQKLARFKNTTFNHARRNTEMLSVIPLFEGVGDQLRARRTLEQYLHAYRKAFRTSPTTLRPFLARSDPAMISGLVATVLANKIALADLQDFSHAHGIATHPILGVGSLPFRGGLTPETVKEFLTQYGGVRTVTIQSAFRYDFPLASVRRAIRLLEQKVPETATQEVPARDRHVLRKMIRRCEEIYQQTLPRLLPDLAPFFRAVPARRERRLHVGLLAYPRKLGRHTLPRAISFTAGFYTLGIPPEFIGLGRALTALSQQEQAILDRYYPTLRSDVLRAGRFVHKEQCMLLARTRPAWADVVRDIEQAEAWCGEMLGPRTEREQRHARIVERAFRARRSPKKLSSLIAASGALRRSLG